MLRQLNETPTYIRHLVLLGRDARLRQELPPVLSGGRLGAGSGLLRGGPRGGRRRLPHPPGDSDRPAVRRRHFQEQTGGGGPLPRAQLYGGPAPGDRWIWFSFY